VQTHRMRLTSAWRKMATPSLGYERVFHSPTGLGPRSRVYLALHTSAPPARIVLNDKLLPTMSGTTTDMPTDSGSWTVRLRWRVEGQLLPVNRLTVDFDGSPLASGKPSTGDAGLDRSGGVPTVIECFLEIEEDSERV